MDDKEKRRRETYSARTYEDLVALGKARGYAAPGAWALKIHIARQRKLLGLPERYDGRS